MLKISLFFIKLYQKTLSPDTGFIGKHLISGKTCGFYPTCSEYTRQALVKYGFLKGWKLGVKRILRCTPKNAGQIDNP